MDERDHLVGLHGLALLRAGATDDDTSVAAHLAAIRELVASAGSPRSRTLRAVSPAEGYAHWAQSYDDRRNATIAAEEQAVHSLLLDRPAGDAVDVGCGTGRHTDWLIQRGHRVTAVDPSAEMLAVAARRNPAAQTVSGDVRNLPLGDRCADVVVCALVLSHLPDLTPITELSRLLRPGGLLVISNPHPTATAVLGSRAWTTTPDGERVRIPEYAHQMGSYIAAFRTAGLVPVALLEPSHPSDDALLGQEPAVVVWGAELQA